MLNNYRIENDEAIFDCGCKWKITGYVNNKPTFDIEYDHLPDCKMVWDMLAQGKCKGVFQLESQLGRQWCELKPESKEHMSALGAILRPGSLESLLEDGQSTTKHYSLRKNNFEETPSVNPVYDEILKESYGLNIYQEQAIKMAEKLAGFTPTQADLLRRSIGKKDAETLFKIQSDFIEGCKKTGIDEDLAKVIFEGIKKSSRYSFNKSLVPHTSFVETESGIKNLTELQVGNKVNSPNGFVEVLDKMDHGQLEVWEIELENGNKIQTTLLHKFLVSDGRVLPLWEIIADQLEIVVQQGN